ncbi:hypothetical protein AMK59_4529 [Oryctes borbonicus]|uniref:Integrin beta subunit tail domain-containing protein n=1 Tax=Oryctes borbonicus TaxID=1629725 RepID=A0A0T6B7B0_9SCAR|nr:hypothetical protein AMK59_4529 [Oryctes borbonicus]
MNTILTHQISSSVELKDNATSTIKVNYYSQCLNATGPEKKTNKCGNIKVGDVVEFKIEIEVTSCPIDPKEWNQTLQIYPVGLNESLIVDIEMLCSCPCEKPGNLGYEEHSKKCSEAGTYKCGICECDSQHFGTTCQCTALGMNANIVDNCRPANSTVDCSGRGVCSCGRCECYSRDDNEKIYGTYCECDDFSCDRHEGLICGGPDHGICQCGVCICKDSWGGAACQCKLSTDTCYAPDVIDGEICSGRGVCECGVCKCNSTDKVKYSGRFCEKCPTCADRCEEFKDCVQCQVFENGPLKKEDCLSNCTKFTPDSVDYIEKNQENDEILCTFIDEDDCRFYFVYYFDDQKKIHVKVQKHRECPPAVIKYPTSKNSP